MKTVARLYGETGAMDISGQMYERLAPSVPGLLVHYPFDSTIRSASVAGTGWNGSRSANGAIQDIHFLDSVRFVGGQRITFAGWFRRTGTVSGTINVQAYNHNGTTWFWDATGINGSFVLNEWVYIERTLTVSEALGTYKHNCRLGLSMRADCTSGTLEWRDLHCYLEEVIGWSSHYTYNDKQIVCQDAFTNLVPSPRNFSATAWPARENVTVSTGHLDPYGTNYAVKVTPNSATDNFFGSRTSVMSAYNEYVVSVWLKATKPCTVPIIAGNLDVIGGFIMRYLEVTTEWKRYVFDGELTRTPSNCIHIGGWNTWSDRSFDVYMAFPQIAVGYAHSDFFDGQQVQKSILSIPNHFVGSAGSISMRATMTQSYYTGGYRSLFSNIWGSGVPAFMMFMDAGTGELYGHYPNTSGGHTYWSADDYPRVSSGEIHYVLTWENKNLRLYRNGNLQMNIANNNMDMGRIATSFSRFFIGSHPDYLPWGRIRDVSIFNRAITADEVKHIYIGKPTMPDQHGNLIAENFSSKIESNPNGLYFPLGVDGSDFNNVISPRTESNTAYENGTCWIGESKTNLLYDDGVINWTVSNLTGVVTRTEIVPNSRYLIRSTTAGSFRMLVPLSKLTNGTRYTMSYKMKINSGTSFLMTDWCDVLFAQVSQDYGTYRYCYGGASRASYDSTFRFMDFFISANTEVEIWDVQLEAANYPSAFTNGTRAAASLHLPYNILDLKRDFTIYGWWFPKIYADGVYRACLTRNRISSNFTNKRLLIMGNSTVGSRLRCWAGSDGSTELSNIYAPNSKPVVVDQWNFFCLRRMNNHLRLGIGNNDSFAFGTAINAGTSLSTDEDATQWGWMIGQYGSTPSEAYHKDYAFIQAALSDAEIDAIFKRKLKLESTCITTTGGIREGIIL